MKKLRKFLTDEELNDIASKYNPVTDTDIFNLLFTTRTLRAQVDKGNEELQLLTIVRGLQDAIHEHGPITRDYVSSAAKRIRGRMRGIKEP